MIKFDVKNRWTDKVQFTAEINAAEDSSQSLKLRLAVKWAVSHGADLSEANLYEADLYEADLRGANLRGANLRGANLNSADLREAYLRGANLYGANLYGADLSEAYLYGANLSGANLSGADLRGAYLRGANLRGADLRGAHLRGANLRGADLRGADLIDAGQDTKGYRFIAYKYNGEVIVTVGCRTFTLKEAKAHWEKQHLDKPELHAECNAKIKLIATVAKAKGW